jgi:hypothetical protein
MNTDHWMATATTAFQAARQGRRTYGTPLPEILYLYRPGQAWMVMSLPPCKNVSMRPAALKVLAKMNGATAYFHVSEGVRTRTEAGEVLGQEDVLIGVLATPQGDAMFLAPAVDRECAPEVVGDLLEGGAPIYGDLAGTMRPLQIDTTFN